MRIVSLLPAATEVLFALGAGDAVVGVTCECDHPPEARTRRIVSTAALPAGLTPAEVDDAVTARAAAGEALHRLEAGALADLDADLVVSQDLCAVCAIPAADLDAALAHLGCAGRVVTMAPHDLASARRRARPRAGRGRRGGCRGAGGRRPAPARRGRRRRGRVRSRADPRAGVERPAWSPGHWIPGMVTLAGGLPVLGTPGGRSERTGWEAVGAARPGVIVCAPCGLALDAAAAAELLARDLLPARCAVWAVDANATFTRPGPRLVDGVESLSAMLHPDRFGPPRPEAARRLR